MPKSESSLGANQGTSIPTDTSSIPQPTPFVKGSDDAAFMAWMDRYGGDPFPLLTDPILAKIVQELSGMPDQFFLQTACDKVLAVGGVALLERLKATRPPTATIHPPIKSKDRIYRWKTLAGMDVDPIPDVVAGFIPGQSVTMFSGDGGLGKSYVLVEMAMQVAAGLPWLGMETTKMPVLIIDLENRLNRVALRVKALTRGWSLNGGVDLDVSFVFESDISLHEEASLAPLYQLIEEHGFGLVILDSLVDFLGGLEENSNTDMAAVCKRLRSVAGKTACSILCIHHVAKSASGTNWQSARGASALKDNSDCSIQVVRSDKGMGDLLTMRHDKARDWAYKSIKAILNWGDGIFNTALCDSGDARDSTSGDKDEQAIMDCLTTTKWRKRSEVIREAMQVTGSKSSSFGRKVKQMIEDELILEDTSDEHGDWGKSSGLKLL